MKNKIVFFGIIFNVIIAAVVVIIFFQQPKTAFVDINKIYNDFTLKKELEVKYNTVSEKRQSILDSLKMTLTLLSKKIDPDAKKQTKELDQFNYMKQEYLLKERKFTEENQTLSNQYSQQVFNQINQYVQDYGKEHGYTYIFGANSSGSLMFANNEKDITIEVTLYVNNKYQGKSK